MEYYFLARREELRGKTVSFKMVMLPPDYHDDWPERIGEAVPGAEVKIFPDPKNAIQDIEHADCAYGYVPPDLFARAKRLRWIQCYAAGPDPSFYHEALVRSDVLVTNFRGIYNDNVGHHAVTLLLALSRHLHRYVPQQLQQEWKRGDAAVYLPDSTVVVVGVGGIGSEVARLCKSFGAITLGLDLRRTHKPDYLDELHGPEKLEDVLPRADFLVITTPDTPQTRGMMNAKRFNLMKSSAFLINVGRGVCVVLEALLQALRSGKIAGAALDVFEVEPLPVEHPLWKMPNVLITPHIAAHKAPYLAERRTRILIGNCQRFARGEPLVNVVDKGSRF
ncbi:D-2-hydroxyacid dehydrogenase [Acidobacteria bacterium AH-259-A15]|nr:D-2-hydroxyacid dehydrogenase [Acidobacteria bacterium AH-259-A15]